MDSPEFDLPDLSSVSEIFGVSPSSPSLDPECDRLECCFSRLRTWRARSIFCIVTAAACSTAILAAAPGQGQGRS